MVPVCFPSKISSTTGLREAVVFALPSVTGLVRWTDYIPVKLVASADAALEGRTDAGGFIPMDMLSSNTGLMGWVDYLPVYVDNSATDAWAITATGFIPYAASGGFVSTGPAVSSITSATQTEGTSLVHTVTLASAVAVTEGLYPFSIGGGTATSGTDYTATPTFSAGVTRSGGTLTVPVGVSSFTITVSTTNDTVYEGTETYTVSVGSMSNTGTLTDNDSAPTVTGVSSASATEASSIVHTVTVTGTAQAAQTYAISLSGGTATGGGTDYTSTLTNGAFSAGVTISGGNISVPSGVTSFTVTVPTTSDVLEEGNETYTLTIGGASGTGTIVDDDAPSPAFTATLTALTNATGTVTTLAYINGGGGGSSPAFTATLTALTNATGTVTTLAYINPGSGSLIEPSATANRTSGVAPLAVHFDATGTTASAWTSKPFLNLDCLWNFGDPDSGTWARGAYNALGLSYSKNVQRGLVAMKVFETPGTYVVNATISGYGDSANTAPITITVTDPNEQWAGTKTVCISKTGSFTGAPPGCTQITDASSTANALIATHSAGGDKRILFNRGENWGISAAIAINQPGPGYIGSYGSGANPVLAATGGFALSLCNVGTNSFSYGDWRFVDIDFDSGGVAGNTAAFTGVGTMSNVTWVRVRAANTKIGWNFPPDNMPATMWDGHCVYDCHADGSTVDATDNGGNSFYFGGTRFAVMGSLIDPNFLGEHGLRSPFGQKHSIVHNTTKRVLDGRAFISMRAPSQNGTLFPTGTWGSVIRSEYLYVGDNFFDRTGSAANAYCSIGCGPTNQSATGEFRQAVFEGNYGDLDRAQLALLATDAVFRNNIMKVAGGGNPVFHTECTTDGSGLSTESENPNSPMPTGISWFHNSIYNSGTAMATLFSPIGAPMYNTVGNIQNNMEFGPNVTTPATPVNVGSGTAVNSTYGTTMTAGNNTASGQITTNGMSTTVPPVTAANYKPQAGAYSTNGGTVVPVWFDFYGIAIPATGSRHIGAIAP